MRRPDPAPAHLDTPRVGRYRPFVAAKDEDDDTTSEIPTSQRVTIEELEALMAAAVDEDGNDIRLAEATARMTPEERRQADEILRAWAAAFQAGLIHKHAKPTDV